MNNTTLAPDLALLHPFDYHDHDVRTAFGEDGAVWFCAKDVAACLDISWSGKTLRNLPSAWTSMIRCITEHGDREVLFLSEPALYRFVFRSNKPQAIAFANWVCAEVLPAIRKTGGFGRIESRKDRLDLSKQYATLLKQISDTQDGFIMQALLRDFRAVCNMLGYPMPSLDMLGTDYRQMLLPKVEGGDV